MLLICLCTCMCVCICVQVHIAHVHVHIYACTCTCIYMYVYMYVYKLHVQFGLAPYAPCMSNVNYTNLFPYALPCTFLNYNYHSLTSILLTRLPKGISGTYFYNDVPIVPCFPLAWLIVGMASCLVAQYVARSAIFPLTLAHIRFYLARIMILFELMKRLPL